MTTVHHTTPEAATCEIDGIGLALAFLDMLTTADTSMMDHRSIQQTAHAAHTALRAHLSAIEASLRGDAPNTPQPASSASVEGDQ